MESDHSGGSETCMYTFKRVVIAHGFLMVPTQSVSLETLQNRKGKGGAKRKRKKRRPISDAKRIARLQLSSFNRVRFSFSCFTVSAYLTTYPPSRTNPSP
ncbi:hypothetical protein V8C43DRAFT_68738 [Trichoderma afarasin]